MWLNCIMTLLLVLRGWWMCAFLQLCIIIRTHLFIEMYILVKVSIWSVISTSGILKKSLFQWVKWYELIWFTNWWQNKNYTNENWTEPNWTLWYIKQTVAHSDRLNQSMWSDRAWSEMIGHGRGMVGGASSWEAGSKPSLGCERAAMGGGVAGGEGSLPGHVVAGGDCGGHLQSRETNIAWSRSN